jgi:hypothetical protein
VRQRNSLRLRAQRLARELSSVRADESGFVTRPSRFIPETKGDKGGETNARR